MGEGMAGEGLATQHQEEADDARHHGDDAAGQEGVDHEVIVNM